MAVAVFGVVMMVIVYEHAPRQTSMIHRMVATAFAIFKDVAQFVRVLIVALHQKQVRVVKNVEKAQTTLID
ncbi:MAG: hypothetical protein CME98_24065 [Hyphomonas sp.]|nr:hypothetical protein [Hyphomonas sp.]